MIKVVLAEVLPDVREKAYVDQRMEELKQLVYTHGGMEILDSIQQRIKPDYTTYLGKWKVEEVIEYMKEHDAKILIIGNRLKPRQVYNLNEKLAEFEMIARDRIDLILKIFGQHAQSNEAELQIELAAIKHMGPRIFDMSMELGRQWWSGGWGWGWWGAANRGAGETNTEIMKRHLQNRTNQISKELKKYESVRKVHREARKKSYLPTIGLVGYTNAGKSSLTNMLTGKNVYVADKLFATLGTHVGKLYIPSMTWKWTELLINDTIGFIRDLPPGLIQAFKSTLEDSIHADLLLHVVDAADPMVDDKITVVDTILDQIGAKQERVLVFNKMDAVDPEKKMELLGIAHSHDYKEVYFASAVSELGKEKIIQMIVDKTKWR